MLQRQRYDLDYPQSRVRFIDHDAGTVTTLGHVVWPPSGITGPTAKRLAALPR
jgi:hypothetical protein